MTTSRGDLPTRSSEQRNAVWLGLPGTGTERDGALDAAEQALSAVEAAYASWRALLAARTEETLAAQIGKPAGCTCSTN